MDCLPPPTGSRSDLHSRRARAVFRAALILCASFLFSADALALPQSANAKPIKSHKATKALMVMVDGLRADAVENLPMPTLLMLRDGKWKPDYKGCYSWTAHTLYDARPSSAANHTAIATGVTAKKTGVRNNGETPRGNYAEWPSWLARVVDAKPEVKTLFTYTWDGDIGLSPHPKVVDVMAPSVENWPATPGAYDKCGRFVPNILAQDDAPDATMWFIDIGDEGGHESGFYPYGSSYIHNLKIVDRMIGDTLAAIASRPTFKDEDWLIMVTSDHGGYGRDHGIWGGQATTIPVVIAGRNVPSGRLAGMPHNYDLAPMALAHFGIDVSGMKLDSKAPSVAATGTARPLRDGLAAYLPFTGATPENKVCGLVVPRAHGKTVSGAGCGRFGNCLHVESDEGGACGVSLDGSENLAFENDADFAMTLWVRLNKPQPMQTPIVSNKDWANGANPGVVLIAARTTDAVKVPGVCFNCGLGDDRKRLDMGTFDIDYGEWVFYAVTRNSEGILSIYQGGHDGRLYWIAEEAASMKLKTGLPFVIGQSGTQKCKVSLKGDVDDFALWTRALTHDEIRSIYESGQKGKSIGEMAAVAAQASQPVVGLADVCPAEGSSVPSAYADAFRMHGADTRLLSWTNDLAAIGKMVDGIDILVLCGGEDINPARYKAQPSPCLGAVNKRRDAFEWVLLDAAVKRRKTVFGICRGHQLINVYFGGTLWQDLPSEFPVKEVMHRRYDAPDVPVHGLTVDPEGFLFRIFGEADMRVNSTHHQAVKDLAPGFSVCARSPDGVVEAIADETRHVRGVQFHPERMFKRDAKWGRLFKAVLEDAARIHPVSPAGIEKENAQQ